MPSSKHWKDQIRWERIKRNWRQQDLAKHLKTTIVTVQRWERGKQEPSAYFRVKLCALFGKSAEELGFFLEAPQRVVQTETQTTQNVWSIPHYRNPFFVGRETLLQDVHHRFFTGSTIQALSGLAGIGKTQVALEYAYRFRTHYQAVLWLGAESLETVTTECLQLTLLLHLSERVQNKQEHAPLTLLKEWLQKHEQWLLILDNLEDLTLLSNIVPTLHTGHVLITTREQALGSLAQHTDLGMLTEEEGAFLLLRRSKLLPLEKAIDDAPANFYTQAREVASLLDGLPLALDQAGAYIEESGCNIADYLDRYRTSRALLLERRGNVPGSHTLPVTTTFNLSFTRLAKRDALATKILYLCAFLAPDAIPEEFLGSVEESTDEQTSRKNGDAVAIDAAMTMIRQFSLLHRHHSTQTLSIHRLVQIVLKDQMDEQTQKAWAERAVRIVSCIFPCVEHLTTWSQCQRYLPHASICIELIEQWQLDLPEAAYLVRQMSAYLRECARSAQAETILTRFSFLFRQELHPPQDMITEFFSFMRHAYYQGTYHADSAVIREYIARLEQMLGPEHPDRIYLQIGIAFFLQMEGKYLQAEQMYRHALTMEQISLLYERLALSEEIGTAGLPHVAFVLSMLGQLYTVLEKRQEAEVCFQQSCAIWDQYTHLPPHLFKGPYLHGFALLCLIEGRYALARDLLLQEQTLLEEILGEDHPIRADNDNALAALAMAEGEDTTAEALLKQAEKVLESIAAINHPFAANTFHLWAQLYLKQGNVEDAEKLCFRAIEISESTQGATHPKTASCLKTLGDIFCCQGRWLEAEPLYQHALTLNKDAFGTAHSHYLETLASLSRLPQFKP